MRLNVIKRKCGMCRACCTTMDVAELRKPGNVTCEHVCESGCGIYDTRPGGCRLYNCAWLQGLLTEEQRPDRLGLELHPDPSSRLHAIAKGRFLIANEVWSGASQAEPAANALKLLSATGWLVYVRQMPPYLPGQMGRSLIGPAELVVQAQGLAMYRRDADGGRVLDSIPAD
jgi:hypothetical protein